MIKANTGIDVPSETVDDIVEGARDWWDHLTGGKTKKRPKKPRVERRSEPEQSSPSLDSITKLPEIINSPSQQVAALTEPPTSPSIKPETTTSTTGNVDGFQVVLLIHGIRTQADWGPMVRSKLEVPGQIVVIPINYGYFDAFRFWFPFWTRSKPVEKVYVQIRVALQKYRRDHPDAKLSIIAHSFGTYVVGQILKRGFDLKIHRLVLCGSVLRQDFPWHEYQGRFDDDKVVNECGKADIWPVLAQSCSWGYGASGTHGFGAALVKDRFHAGGHGQYFEPEFVEKYWEPFIRRREYGGTEFEVKIPTTPSWVSLMGILPLKWLICCVILVVAMVFFVRPNKILPSKTNPCNPDAPPPSYSLNVPNMPQDYPRTLIKDFGPVVTRNSTGHNIRLWYYPLVTEKERGWRYYDLCETEGGIDNFPLGLSYFKVQNLDIETPFLQISDSPPFDVGWRRVEPNARTRDYRQWPL